MKGGRERERERKKERKKERGRERECPYVFEGERDKECSAVKSMRFSHEIENACVCECVCVCVRVRGCDG